MTAPEPKTPIFSAVWGLPPSLVFTKKVPNIETKIPDAAKNNGKNTRLFSPAVAAKTVAPIIEPTYDSNKKFITSCIFRLKSIPSALYKCLGGFATNQINMTKLESYINPQGFDVAQFYTDIEGHPENQKVKLALEEMKYYCKHVDILGVYKMSNFRKK